LIFVSFFSEGFTLCYTLTVFQALREKTLLMDPVAPTQKPLTENENSYTMKLCPKGRKIIARGVSPWR
jgi:hypothetical protein